MQISTGSSRDLRGTDVSIRDWDRKEGKFVNSKAFGKRADTICPETSQWTGDFYAMKLVVRTDYKIFSIYRYSFLRIFNFE